MFWSVFAVVLLAQVTPPDSSLSRAIETLRQSTHELRDVRGALEIVKAALLEDESSDTWRSVRALLDDDLDGAVQRRVFDVLIDSGKQKEQHLDLVDFAARLGRQNHDHPVVHVLIRKLETGGAVWENTKNSSELGDLLVFIAMRVPRPQPMMLIGKMDLPRSVKRAYALQIIADRQEVPDVELALQALIADDMVPQLRQMVEQRDELHGCAAAALAFLGDVGIREELEKRLKAGQSVYYIKRFLWQIDVQRNGALLNEIATTHDADGGVGKIWALDRAVHAGIAKERIRSAIFRCAESYSKIKPDSVAPRLISLKKHAVLLGILQPEELPDVPVR